MRKGRYNEDIDANGRSCISQLTHTHTQKEWQALLAGPAGHTCSSSYICIIHIHVTIKILKMISLQELKSFQGSSKQQKQKKTLIGEKPKSW